MRENIWFGNLDIQPDDERIVQAARDSGIDSTISSFASGYDTMFGKWLENGEELSIGQAQKLALARTSRVGRANYDSGRTDQRDGCQSRIRSI